MAILNDVRRAPEHACGDRMASIGNNYNAILHSFDYPRSTRLPAQIIVASAAILRVDSQLSRLLRLSIANIEADPGNLTMYDDNIRDELRAVAKEKP